jgi:hypothetical protein
LSSYCAPGVPRRAAYRFVLPSTIASGPVVGQSNKRRSKGSSFVLLTFLYTELQVFPPIAGSLQQFPVWSFPAPERYFPAFETLKPKSPPKDFQKSSRDFVLATDELLASANLLWTPISASFDFADVILHQTSSLRQSTSP